MRKWLLTASLFPGLRQSSCKPRLYVGSSVNEQDGIYGRFINYWYIAFQASSDVRNGFEITYFALPFYFTKPSNPALLGFVQTLVLSVEHTLTFRLWTMVGRWRNCESLALWNRSDQEHDGANGHSPMKEIRSLGVIEPDDIAQFLQERKEKNKRQHKIWLANHKEVVRTYNNRWIAEHQEEMKAHKRAWNEANADYVNKYQRARAKKAKEPALLPCDGFLKPFANKKELERHQGSEVACKPKRDAARTARETCGGCSKVFA